MPQQAQFDLNAARQSGASDDQILGYLAQRSPNFDTQAALKQASKADVINYLSTHAVAPESVAQSQQQAQQPSFSEKLTAGYNPGATDFADKHPVLGPAVRFLDAAGGAMLSVPSSLYHAVADDPTEQEQQEFQGHTRIPGELAIERLTGAPLVRGAQQYADPNTRPTLKQAMSVLPEALGQATGSYAGSDLLGKGVGKVTEATVAPLLQKSAKTQYMKALSPTKAENKFLAQKITPGLLERGVSGSLEGINKTADAALEETGPQIDQAINDPVRAHLYKAVPQAKQLAIQPVLDSLETYKDNFKVGTTEMRPDAVARVSELQDTIKQLGPDVSYASLNKARQILDQAVAEGKGYYGKTLSEGGVLDVQREAANAMRSALAKDRPDIAKINAEYSFWSNVAKVTGDTISRRSGQEGALLPKLAGIGGLATGHAAPGTVMYLVGRAIQSPRWRTFSAIKKTQIANALASGDAGTVTKLLGVGATAYRTQSQE